MKVDESISSSTQFPQRLLQRKRGILRIEWQIL